jgi:uncharacterized coiled-coil protein SlyX
MLTSNPHALRDTVIAGAVAAVLALVLSPGNPAMVELPVHPAWIVALVLAARYGARGLYAVPAVIAGVQAAVWVSGHADLSMVTRLGRPGELLMLLTVSALATVGAMHEARKSTLEGRLGEAELRATVGESAVDTLSETLFALRDRCDRSQTSLAVLSDLAMRLDDTNQSNVGDAALTLAMSRTGARGGFVQLFDGTRLRTLCSRGAWSAERLAPPTLFRDLVATAAFDQVKQVAAHEVESASADDSDLAAPLLDGGGTPVGVLALRGISYPSMTLAAREDLAAVARWAGRAFGAPSRGVDPRRIQGVARAS